MEFATFCNGYLRYLFTLLGMEVTKNDLSLSKTLCYLELNSQKSYQNKCVEIILLHFKVTRKPASDLRISAMRIQTDSDSYPFKELEIINIFLQIIVKKIPKMISYQMTFCPLKLFSKAYPQRYFNKGARII